MTVWRWRHDPLPGTPEGNMATDAGLLDEMRERPHTLPIIRVYTWDRPCVTAGRWQDAAAVRAAFPGLPLVRRPTGGRAVRHGEDLTLTVAAHLCDLPAAGTSVLATYRLLAGCLVDAFQAFAIPAEFGAGAGATERSADCFASAARCDLVDARTGSKLAGCAQRRVGTALLQQMSIPLKSVPDPTAFLNSFRHSAVIHLGVSAWIPET